jgi:hypothetical protein
VAVVATLSKGYDLDYIWKNVDRGPAKDAAVVAEDGRVRVNKNVVN